MGSFSNHWENVILDHLFGKGNYAPPVIHVGLSTSDPTESGAGLSEPSGNGYSRVQTTEADWSVAVDGLLSNAADITFDAATGDWGTVTHFALFNAASAGNMLAYGALTQAKTIGNGDTVQFASGDLNITLD